MVRDGHPAQILGANKGLAGTGASGAGKMEMKKHLFVGRARLVMENNSMPITFARNVINNCSRCWRDNHEGIVGVGDSVKEV